MSKLDACDCPYKLPPLPWWHAFYVCPVVIAFLAALAWVAGRITPLTCVGLVVNLGCIVVAIRLRRAQLIFYRHLQRGNVNLKELEAALRLLAGKKKP